MKRYIIWGKNATVFNRKDIFQYVLNKDKIATSKLCGECKIFDRIKQKCTHPSFGCESNPARFKPWESEAICPKKIKPS